MSHFRWLFGVGAGLALLAACSSGSSGADPSSAGSGGQAGASTGGGGAGSGGKSAGGSNSGGSDSGGSDGAGSDAGGSDAGGESAGGSAAGGEAAGGAPGSGTCCVEGSLSWSRVGGFVAWTESSTLAPCATYSHQRTPAGTDPADLSCMQDLAVCAGGSLGVSDVTAALAHDDVQAAVAEAPVLYGGDPRPVDGQVLQIVIGDAVFEVGSPCLNDACPAIPEGVQALADLLLALDDQELGRAPCSDVFE